MEINIPEKRLYNLSHEWNFLYTQDICIETGQLPNASSRRKLTQASKTVFEFQWKFC